MFHIEDKSTLEQVKTIQWYATEQILAEEQIKLIYKKICKDKELYTHCNNVAVLSTVIGLAYNFNLNELIEMCTGAMLHDAGKLNLNRAILYKNSVFSSDERQYAQTHTTTGYQLLRDTNLSDIALNIVKSHHEKLDGTGYPCALKRREIPIYTQIVTVSDMYDAMTTDRCYRKALHMDEACNILYEDPGVNKTALSILKESIKEYNCVPEVPQYRYA